MHEFSSFASATVHDFVSSSPRFDLPSFDFWAGSTQPMSIAYKREILRALLLEQNEMGCFRLQRRSKEPPNKLLKMVGLASCSSSREKETSSSMPRESSDSAPNDGISPPRMNDFHSAPSSVWPEFSPSRSPARASSRGTPMPLPLPLKRRQLKSQQHQQPLPLPKPTPAAAAASTSPKLSRIPSRPHPLPLPADDHVPVQPTNTFLRSFDFEHMARLCRNFSAQCQIRGDKLGPVYRCSMMIDDTTRELDVVRFTNKPLQDEQVEEWVAKLKISAQLEHDNICKLIGFSIQPDGERLLVLESSGSGESLDRVLAAASAKNQVLDWDARMKIALGAALGLAYLHNKEVAYPSSLGSSNIVVDKDCNVKLVDYFYEDWEDPSCQQKANVRSYGILLLELLTGKQQMERLLPQGRDLVQWARPFVNDTAKLSSILDPRLGQRPATRAAKDLANFAINCLYSDPRLRPTMREAVSLLKALTTTSSSSKDLFGRSATFSMRGMMSPMSSNPYQARSAGASPARYASPLSSASLASASASASAPFLSCSSSLAYYYEDVATRQRRRLAQFSR